MSALRKKIRPRCSDGLQATDWDVRNARQALGRWAGGWQAGTDRPWLRVTSPATGELIGFTSFCDLDDLEQAVRSARAAADRLAAMPLSERIGLCREISDRVLENRRHLAALLTLEQGKDIEEAAAEIEAAARAFADAARIGRSLHQHEALVQAKDRLTLGHRRNVGVIALIAGHAYPVGVPALACLAPAIATGNSVVWQPAPTTSLVSAALVECITRAGLPVDSVCLLPGERGAMGGALMRHPDVAAAALLTTREESDTLVSTWSNKVIYREECETGLVIVAADADIDAAAGAIAARSFANAGQFARTSARVVVHAEIHDRFVQALSALAQATATDAGDAVGPVNHLAVLERAREQIREARRRGARVVGGAIREDSPTGLHLVPAVVSEIDRTSLLNAETSCGPIVPVRRFRSAEDLRGQAVGPTDNAISVFTRSPDQALTMAASLGAEAVTVNEVRGCLDGEATERFLRRRLEAMAPLTTLSMRLPLPVDAKVSKVRPVDGIRRRGSAQWTGAKTHV